MDYWRYELWRMRARHAIERVLDTLTHREREIIKLRTGMGDGYVYTLEEVGKIFNVTRERVRQIEAKGMRKLLHPVRLKRLKGLLEEVVVLHSEPSQKYTPEEIAEHMPEHETVGMVARMRLREQRWGYYQNRIPRKQNYGPFARTTYHSMAAAEAIRQHK